MAEPLIRNAQSKLVANVPFLRLTKKKANRCKQTRGQLQADKEERGEWLKKCSFASNSLIPNTRVMAEDRIPKSSQIIFYQLMRLLICNNSTSI